MPAAQALEFHCPRWSELPAIELYVDQVTGYINDVFAPLNVDPSEKVLTKAMVNNYVKLKVMEAPHNKKYAKSHIAHLLAICVLKQMFSIPDIAQLIRSQVSHCSIEIAYDCMCNELEVALQESFRGQQKPVLDQLDEPTHLLMLTMQACANKIYVQKRMFYEQNQAQKPGAAAPY